MPFLHQQIDQQGKYQSNGIVIDSNTTNIFPAKEHDPPEVRNSSLNKNGAAYHNNMHLTTR
jgi:hypothetical protein